ncbi:polyA polymerase cid, putative [Entamoeba invadens IP1]|uniref:PolyA polymerase cid, putative n=1 Tax=Entamoeba invadens TaxID=33085 RepID=S0B1H4_ENTIV|nr:polyA polymerase cid, putative [Entamoeba invadens IP1]ELP85220.1 polyA polymerase cid, putative [Entamoeba invadens IP1]BAN41650.1 polyA polymerase cid, putative [Entamoeba invadens]|eukprot:XP_004184566.1 polyA polymerase cid, putative [Entamoeba invadens IP1]
MPSGRGKRADRGGFNSHRNSPTTVERKEKKTPSPQTNYHTEPRCCLSVPQEDLIIHRLTEHTKLGKYLLQDDVVEDITSEKLVAVYNQIKQRAPKPEQFIAKLSSVFNEIYESSEVKVYGSGAYDFIGEDLDVTLVINQPYTYQSTYERKKMVSKGRVSGFISQFREDKICELTFISEQLTRQRGFGGVNMIGARVPIIKCYIDRVSVDISLDNYEGIYNSEFLKEYLSFDKNLSVIVYYIKETLRTLRVIDPMHGGFNSFCVVVMTIYYLQQRGLLPDIQSEEYIQKARNLKYTIVEKVALVNLQKVEYVTSGCPFFDEYKRKLSEVDVIETIDGFFTFYGQEGNLRKVISLHKEVTPDIYPKPSAIEIYPPFVPFLDMGFNISFRVDDMEYLFRNSVIEVLKEVIKSRSGPTTQTCVLIKKIMFDTTPIEVIERFKKFNPKEALFYLPELLEAKSVQMGIAFIKFSGKDLNALLKDKTFTRNLGYTITPCGNSVFDDPPNGGLYWNSEEPLLL